MLWNLCGIYLSTGMLWNSAQLFTGFTNMENWAESTAAQCVFEVIHSFHRNYYYDYSLILILFLSSCELFDGNNCCGIVVWVDAEMVKIC